MQRIAIIGGGAAGAALVGEFLRRASHGVALTWLVGRRAPGRGVAYATSAEQHLLNVRAANMGLFADDVGALLRFAQERGFAVSGTDFLPRGVFGDYVESTLARLIATHATPRTLTLRTVEARAVRGSDAEGYVVTTDDESHIEADAVVLALGALPPKPLAGVSCAALASGRYAVDAWQLPRLAQAPRRIVVIGTGLSGVDVILSAAATWPDAQIVAVSRHGRLPQTHLPVPGAPYEFQRELTDTLRARADVRVWLRALRDAIDDADDWRAVIDGLRSATVELWQA
ncbi:MAG TPA: FAD/NAD(P)-binding protein, partial [Rudaea sp.]